MERALPTVIEICRSLSLAWYLSRNASLILRIDNLACATACLLPRSEINHANAGCPADSYPLSPAIKPSPGMREMPARHAVKPWPAIT